MNIRKLILTLYFSISICGISSAQNKTLTVSPGTLAQSLDSISTDLETLTLSGSADYRDLSALADFTKAINTVDMSALKIVAYSGPYVAGSENRSYNANELPEGIFMNTSIHNFLLPAGICGISECAFAGSSVESVTIPESVTEICDYAFYGCDSLKNTSKLPALKIIGKGAFENCTSLSVFIFPASLQSIGDRAFDNTGLTEVSVPAGVALGNYVFANNSELSEAEINCNTTKTVGTFFNCKSLKKVNVNGNTVPSLYVALSPQTNITDMVDKKNLGEYAFYGNNTSKLNLSTSLDSISAGVFGNLPLDTIYATSLDQIPVTDSLAFENVDPSKVWLIVKDDKADLWKNSTPWNRFNILTESAVQVVGVNNDSERLETEISGGILTITTLTPWKDLYIYTTNGVLLTSSHNKSILNFPIDGYHGSVILIRIKFSNNQVKTLKLLI